MAEKRSRGKLAADLGACGLEQKIMEILRCHENLREELVERSCGVNYVQRVAGCVTIQRGVGRPAGEQEHAIAMHDGPESDQGG